MVQQIEIQVPPLSRGFHIITRTVLQQVPNLPKVGLFNLFIQHTSAGLMINEIGKSRNDNQPFHQRLFRMWFRMVLQCFTTA